MTKLNILLPSLDILVLYQIKLDMMSNCIIVAAVMITRRIIKYSTPVILFILILLNFPIVDKI